MPVTFVRTYNSDDPRDGIFGRSWTFNYNVSLTENPDLSIDIRRGDGRIHHFFWNGTHYQGPNTVNDTLVKNTDGTYQLTLKADKSAQNFNAQGRLISIRDKNGNIITFTYDGEGNLTTITDPNGNNIILSYNAGKKVERITLSDGRYAGFIYDANNNLVLCTDNYSITQLFFIQSRNCFPFVRENGEGA